MSDLKSLFFHLLIRLRRSALFRSPAHLLPASYILLVALLSTISFFLPVYGSSRQISPRNQLISSVHTVYKSLGIPIDDELGLKKETDIVTIDKGEPGLRPAVKVQTALKGQSIYTILTASGLAPAEVHQLIRQLKGRYNIKEFKVGTTYELETNPDGTFNCLSWHLNPSDMLHLEKDEHTGTLSFWKEAIETDTRQTTLEGTVQSTLAKEMSLKGHPGLTAQLRKLLSSKLDLGKRLPVGSRYRILFEEQLVENRITGTGKILAVEISSAKRHYNVYLFTDAKGNSAYYDEYGRSLQNRQMFVQPCSYSRVSSGFGYRIHPITGAHHFHGGVDLVAPVGTPVRAVADGNVIFRGREGGTGNMITIAHADGIHTIYMHLSRFSPAVGYGKKVRQGDIIAYVGSTGSATGPHLDFRVIRNGRTQNPMIALKEDAPKLALSSTDHAGFMARVSRYHTQLDKRPVLVAGLSKRRPTTL
jgi:murein DD-endopeptidase MepM/ murein hydrolase activator NlpD